MTSLGCSTAKKSATGHFPSIVTQSPQQTKRSTMKHIKTSLKSYLPLPELFPLPIHTVVTIQPSVSPFLDQLLGGPGNQCRSFWYSWITGTAILRETRFWISGFLVSFQCFVVGLLVDWFVGLVCLFFVWVLLLLHVISCFRRTGLCGNGVTDGLACLCRTNK